MIVRIVQEMNSNFKTQLAARVPFHPLVNTSMYKLVEVRDRRLETQSTTYSI